MRKMFFCFAGLFLFFKVSACAENIAVIVNSESPIFSVKAAPALNDIKEIYLGKVKYWKGVAVKPVNLKDKEMLDKFVEKTCGMHVPEYRNYWVKAALESGLEAPKVVETSKEVISFVQREKTGMGYVLESEAIGIGDIKIIVIINE